MFEKRVSESNDNISFLNNGRRYQFHDCFLIPAGNKHNKQTKGENKTKIIYVERKKSRKKINLFLKTLSAWSKFTKEYQQSHCVFFCKEENFLIQFLLLKSASQFKSRFFSIHCLFVLRFLEGKNLIIGGICV